MDVGTFLAQRRSAWAQLESLLDEADRSGLKSMGLEDVQRLGRLYREASADLVWARTRHAGVEVVDYLNALVARAYARIHPPRRLRWEAVITFFRVDYPRLVRRHLRPILLAMAVFMAGGLFGAGGMAFDPNAGSYLLPEEHRDLDPQARVARDTKGGVLLRPDGQAAFSAYLFTHNIEVSVVAFALGLLGGVLTALILFMNGVFIGALAYAYHADGVGLFFWAWVLPRGSIALSAVFIAGGAGFVLGRALLAPGQRSRRDALREDGAEAVRLVLGLAPILVVAGLVEGTLSQWHMPWIPPVFKILFALVLGTMLWLWLLRSGRGRAGA